MQALNKKIVARLADGLQFDGAANPTLLQELAKAGLGFYVIFLSVYLSQVTWHAGFLFDLHHYIVGRDFLNLWFAGKLALLENPSQYYDPDLYMQALNAAIGEHYIGNQLSYPPTQFLLGLPFGLLPYNVAYPAWLALNLGAIYWSVRPLINRSLFVLLLISPAALVWLLCGQSSLLCAALILGAFRLIDSAPRRAGILIGLLIIKPQLALLFPLFLLVTKRWRVFFFAGITVLCLMAFSVAWLGVAPWIAYWNTGIPQQAAVFIYTTDMIASLMPTIFNDLRLMGVPPAFALGVQSVQTIIVAGCLLWHARRQNPLPYTLLLFTTTSLLATFYLLSYDLIPFTFALMYVVSTTPLARMEKILFTACFWLPLLDFFLNAYGIPGASFLPALLLIWLVAKQTRRLRSPA